MSMSICSIRARGCKWHPIAPTCVRCSVQYAAVYNWCAPPPNLRACSNSPFPAGVDQGSGQSGRAIRSLIDSLSSSMGAEAEEPFISSRLISSHRYVLLNAQPSTIKLRWPLLGGCKVYCNVLTYAAAFFLANPQKSETHKILNFKSYDQTWSIQLACYT
jgi:hypothetical protein